MNKKEFTTRDFMVAVFPAILTVFIIFFLIMPRVKEGRKEVNIPEQGSEISWQEAINILNSGEVEQVFQSHSLDVSLKLKNGKTLDTKEPQIDDIFDEVEKCGETCEDVILATE